MELYWIIAGVGVVAAIVGGFSGWFAHRPAIKRLEAIEPQIIQVAGAEVGTPFAKCFHCDHIVAKYRVRNNRIECMNCQMEGRE